MRNFEARCFWLSIMTALSALGATPSTGPTIAPTTRPLVPALEIDATPPLPRSFVVDGAFRGDNGKGLSFRVAVDGERQSVLLCDLTDGTPVYLSDGQQTLIYDLIENRIVRLPVSRAYIRLSYEPTEAKPATFTFGVHVRSDSKKLAQDNSWVRFNHFAEAPDVVKENGPDGPAYVRVRAGTIMDILQHQPNDPSVFQFISQKQGKSPTLAIAVDHIGQPVPDAMFRFPDTAQFPPVLRLTEFDAKSMPAFLKLLNQGTVFMSRLALLSPDLQQRLDDSAGTKIDWDSVAHKDQTLAPAFRAELRRQGVESPALGGRTTTAPARP